MPARNAKCEPRHAKMKQTKCEIEVQNYVIYIHQMLSIITIAITFIFAKCKCYAKCKCTHHVPRVIQTTECQQASLPFHITQYSQVLTLSISRPTHHSFSHHYSTVLPMSEQKKAYRRARTFIYPSLLVDERIILG